jgi:DNA repair protein RadC
MYDNGERTGSAGVYLIADLPEHERPRERLLSRGDDALGDAELLAILLRTGTRSRSAVDLARDLLARFEGRLAPLASASVAELASVRGVGQAKALQVKAAFALAKRFQQAPGQERLRVQSPGDVADLLRERCRGKTQEEFYVLQLDSRNFMLRHDCVTIGLADRTQVHAREVFRQAIREGCSRLILAHNHPSGDPTPSPQDVECTRNLVQAGKVIGIDVLDHIVLGNCTATRLRDFLSFRESNLL